MAKPIAGLQPATAAVVQGAVQPQFGDVRIRQRGRLPHWEKDAGLYFLTFHLADSLPLPVLEKIAERHRILIAAKRVGAHLLPSQEVLVAEFSTAKLEEYFDRGLGACFLRDPRLGELVADALHFWQGKRYRLVAWCVMPNHVHVVCRLLPGQELSKVLQGWKSFTARKANEILGRGGAFWQREYYDRLIRNGDELERAVRYGLNNPERAGLKVWKWVWGPKPPALFRSVIEMRDNRTSRWTLNYSCPVSQTNTLYEEEVHLFPRRGSLQIQQRSFTGCIVGSISLPDFHRSSFINAAMRLDSSRARYFWIHSQAAGLRSWSQQNVGFAGLGTTLIPSSAEFAERSFQLAIPPLTYERFTRSFPRASVIQFQWIF